MSDNVVKMDEPKTVELEVPAPEEKTKRGRSKKSGKKKEEHLELEQNIAVMVKTVFDMLAVRDPIWTISDTEVTAVTKPGARILARLGAEEETNKNADYFLLIVGIAGIVLPRIMLIRARGQVRQQNEQPERTSTPGSGKSVETSTRNVAGNVKQLLPALG